MPSTTEYDQSLLASAPAPTKAQIQGGYDTAILRPTSAQRSPTPPHDTESGLASKEYVAHHNTTRQPFWRSTKGKILLAVAAIIIIAAVVGGAVGGTVNKNKKPSSNDSSGVGQGSPGNHNPTGVASNATAPSSTSSGEAPKPSSSDSGIGTGTGNSQTQQQTPSNPVRGAASPTDGLESS